MCFDSDKKQKKKKTVETFNISMSLVMVACKRMIPIGLTFLNSQVQEVIQSAKQKFLEVF